MEFSSVTLRCYTQPELRSHHLFFEMAGDARCESTCPHTLHVLQTCVILSLPVPSQPKFGYHTMQKTAAKETFFSLAPLDPLEV